MFVITVTEFILIDCLLIAVVAKSVPIYLAPNRFQIYKFVFLFTRRTRTPMSCSAEIQETNQKKPCWLPAAKESDFGFCRRCHFNAVNSILNEIISDFQNGIQDPPPLHHLWNPSFQTELFLAAREQTVLTLLNTLFHHDRAAASRLLKELQKELLSVLLKNAIQKHPTGYRCAFYSHILRQYPSLAKKTFPKSCWLCAISTLEDFRAPDKLCQDIVSYLPWMIQGLTAPVVEHHAEVFVRALQLFVQKGYTQLFISLLLKLESLGEKKNYAQTLLLDATNDTSMLDFVYLRSILPSLPSAWEKETLHTQMVNQTLPLIQMRCTLYKDELLALSWAPERAIHWCCDIESELFKRRCIN